MHSTSSQHTSQNLANTHFPLQSECLQLDFQIDDSAGYFTRQIKAQDCVGSTGVSFVWDINTGNFSLGNIYRGSRAPPDSAAFPSQAIDLGTRKVQEERRIYALEQQSFTDYGLPKQPESCSVGDPAVKVEADSLAEDEPTFMHPHLEPAPNYYEPHCLPYNHLDYESKDSVDLTEENALPPTSTYPSIHERISNLLGLATSGCQGAELDSAFSCPQSQENLHSSSCSFDATMHALLYMQALAQESGMDHSQNIETLDNCLSVASGSSSMPSLSRTSSTFSSVSLEQDIPSQQQDASLQEDRSRLDYISSRPAAD